jgi:hypothetical protein
VSGETVDGSLLVQEYESTISNGEYSLVYTSGRHTHTIIKTPVKGEFKCQEEFGGGVDEIGMEQVPAKAKEAAVKIGASSTQDSGLCYTAGLMGFFETTATLYLWRSKLLSRISFWKRFEIRAFGKHFLGRSTT